MIKFITNEQTLPIRSMVLRNGLDTELCRFEGDDVKGTFHLGYLAEEEVVSIASFYQNNYSLFSAEAGAVGYQLRGMATLPGSQGRGMGNQLLNFAIIYLRGQKVNYLWCNARKNAFHFYKSMGFEFISDEFQIEGIGTHRSMYLKIQ